MANEPSLSELNSYRPNPELAAGDRNVVQDNSQGIGYLMQAARDKMQNDWNRYAFYQKNLIEGFKDASKFDFVGIRAQDKETLAKQAGEFYAEIAKDPSVLGNPMKNPQAYTNMLQKQSLLNANIAKSKQANAYTQGQNKFMFDNPDLSTEENKGIIKKSNDTSLDDWTPFELSLPSGIDLLKLAKESATSSMVDVPVSEQVFQNKIDQKTGLPIVAIDPTTKKPILDAQGNPTFEQVYSGRTRVGTKKESNLANYENLGKGIWESNPKLGRYGVSFRKGVEDLFNALPQAEKDVLEQDAKAQKKDKLNLFFEKSWKGLYTPQTDLTGIKEQEDKLFAAEDAFKKDVYLQLLKGKQDRDTEYYKNWLGQQNEKDQAKALLQYSAAGLSDAIKNGKRTIDVKLDANNKPIKGTERESVKLNVTPKTLELFGFGGKEQIETIDGVSTTKMVGVEKPDYIEYIPSSKTFRIVYYKRTGDKIDTKGGVKLTDTDKTKEISESQYMATMGKGLFSPSKLAPAFQYATERLGNNSLIDFIEGGGVGIVNKEQPKKGTPASSSSGKGTTFTTKSGITVNVQ